MFDGGEYINSVLSGDSAVTAITTEIHNATLLPQGTQEPCINFYRTSPHDGGKVFFENRWSIQNRADDETGSKELADAVFEAFNRVDVTVGTYKYYGVAEILPVIRPVDKRDSFNCPVELRIRRK